MAYISLPRPEILLFSGVDVDGWLNQIEVFFDQYGLFSEERLAVIHNYLDGEATEWYYEMWIGSRLTTWNDFIFDIEQRFSLLNTSTASDANDESGQVNDDTRLSTVKVPEMEAQQQARAPMYDDILAKLAEIAKSLRKKELTAAVVDPSTEIESEVVEVIPSLVVEVETPISFVSSTSFPISELVPIGESLKPWAPPSVLESVCALELRSEVTDYGTSLVLTEHKTEVDEVLFGIGICPREMLVNPDLIRSVSIGDSPRPPAKPNPSEITISIERGMSFAENAVVSVVKGLCYDFAETLCEMDIYIFCSQVAPVIHGLSCADMRTIWQFAVGFYSAYGWLFDSDGTLIARDAVNLVGECVFCSTDWLHTKYLSNAGLMSVFCCWFFVGNFIVDHSWDILPSLEESPVTISGGTNILSIAAFLATWECSFIYYVELINCGKVATEEISFGVSVEEILEASLGLLKPPAKPPDDTFPLSGFAWNKSGIMYGGIPTGNVLMCSSFYFSLILFYESTLVALQDDKDHKYYHNGVEFDGVIQIIMISLLAAVGLLSRLNGHEQCGMGELVEKLLSCKNVVGGNAILTDYAQQGDIMVKLSLPSLRNGRDLAPIEFSMELTNVTLLELSEIHNIYFTGEIMRDLNLLRNLEEFDRSRIRIAGENMEVLPRLGKLSYLSKGITNIYLLTESIVMAVRSRFLQRLPLLDDELVGPIPPILGNFTYTGILYLHVNKVLGPTPPELGNITRLSYLKSNYYRLVGPIPGEPILLTLGDQLTEADSSYFVAGNSEAEALAVLGLFSCAFMGQACDEEYKYTLAIILKEINENNIAFQFYSVSQTVLERGYYLHELFERSWKENCPVFTIAVEMDPRIKLRLRKFSFSKIFGIEDERWVRLVDRETRPENESMLFLQLGEKWSIFEKCCVIEHLSIIYAGNMAALNVSSFHLWTAKLSGSEPKVFTQDDAPAPVFGVCRNFRDSKVATEVLELKYPMWKSLKLNCCPGATPAIKSQPDSMKSRSIRECADLTNMGMNAFEFECNENGVFEDPLQLSRGGFKKNNFNFSSASYFLVGEAITGGTVIVEELAAQLIPGGQEEADNEIASFEAIAELILQGIKAGDVTKLQGAGIYTYDGLLMLIKKSLTWIKGCSETKVDMICEGAEELVNFGYIIGSDALLKRTAVVLITTGSQAWDEPLGGGSETSACTLLVRLINCFIIFSLPRPPEAHDLEDKVDFKGWGIDAIRDQEARLNVHKKEAGAARQSVNTQGSNKPPRGGM